MQHIAEKIRKMSESKTFVKVLYVLGIFIVAKIIFVAGTIVGYSKASYGQAWEKHYNANFVMGQPEPQTFHIEQGGNPGFGIMSYFPNPHGATGQIIQIDLPRVMIQDRDSMEKVVLVSGDTRIEKGRDILMGSDLRPDDFIISLGTPNTQGQMEAKFIRVIPNPEFLTE